MTDKQFFSVLTLVMAGLFISVGTDFWWGYHETHTVEGGADRVLFGFFVLGIVGLVFMLRRK